MFLKPFVEINIIVFSLIFEILVCEETRKENYLIYESPRFTAPAVTSDFAKENVLS